MKKGKKYLEAKKLVDNTGHTNWKFKPFYTDIDWNEFFFQYR